MDLGSLPPLPPFNNIIEKTVASEVFLGFFALSLGGLIVYQLRNVFEKLYGMYKRRGMFSITVRSHEYDLYAQVIRWLNYKGFSQKFRKVRIDTQICDQEEDDKQSTQEFLYPDDGTYFAFYRGRLLIIDKTTKESKQLEPPEEMTLTVVSWSRKLAQYMIDEIMALQPASNRMAIHYWDIDGWDVFTEKDPRSLDTIYMEPEQKQQITDDIQWFFDNKQWYQQRGIPYYRGYLFYGPPGTGKTTLAFALACHFNKRVYLMNLNTFRTDEELQEAFSRIRKNSIVVIEDVDVMLKAQARNAKFTSDVEQNTDENQDMPHVGTSFSGTYAKGITLSGLLNAMDGILSCENRITILTSNDPDALDKALLRDGRVDRKVYLGYCSDAMKKQMFEVFFPDLADKSNQFVQLYTDQYTPAELQGLFMRNTKTPEKLLQQSEE